MTWSIRRTSDTEFLAVSGTDKEWGDRADVIGRATVRLSGRHPDIASLDVEVEAERRRQGVGTALVAEAAATTERRLMANIEPDEGAEAFLWANGFDVAVDSEVRSVELDALADPEAIAPLPADVRLTVHDEITPDVAVLYDEIYRRCHRWAGRYTPSADAPWIGFLGPPVPGTVVTAAVHDRPVGVASMHPDAEDFGAGADVFLAPTTILLDAPVGERAALLAHLVGESWSAARAAGHTTCATEFDTPYDDLAQVARSVPGATASSRRLWLGPVTSGWPH